ncbi:Uma2 family endonuclease [Roseiflexus castenholzii]|uniref:Putative restriction endonuclease domain-containing protein n=1 Tax=Roseiflexus castenholzii (strain DSM 13941 / HLO8) TaxID=383372 RepID=A7NKA4_ROSCS|nr:Uma2 family endonuclease [Roseiflexus castenholzii]ABU57924.1 protein of unknown function DUF820 [Roseiflexus castenholzii DSM 13941]
MSIAPAQLMTAESFWLLPEGPIRRALVRGEVVETMPLGGRHGMLALRIGARLQQWAEAGGHGVVCVESGFVLARNPDTVRAPDVAFVAAAHIPVTGVPDGFWEQAPDLAVEIVSPSETAGDAREKVRDFLSAGARLVWEVHPRTHEVLVHRAEGSIQALSGDDLLQDPDVLPAFSCRVADIFAPY